ncbi:lipoate-protein ligase A LplA [Thermosynechococcus sp. NK55a]|jgi:lipoate-protein ligase A|uniref:lipoate--protein ligase family protein n=1 Tax=unclassified Thermosynechococcus TaxID=2622553 RepID=UPI0003D8B89A|nr:MULTISPECIES: lipoate--protein ligase family protein [unclassified Thermosynechococcus]AHB87565.1 lipoate-protein ligase A LplA [Thermosynechococcus sp. NK55a]
MWRYIPPFAAPGKVQMAVDCWLWQGSDRPCLRFYTWSPPAISLGYRQRQIPQQWQHQHWQGQPVELVRRPTGGRAVLHQGDLTYSLVVWGLGQRRQQVYADLCQFLKVGFERLGWPLQLGQERYRANAPINCFARATVADLVLPTGEKVIGSAQAWRGDRVLQHGSIVLTPDPNLWQQVFGSVPHRQSLPPLPVVQRALLDAFEAQWQVSLTPEPLSDREWQDINRILNSAWGCPA